VEEDSEDSEDDEPEQAPVEEEVKPKGKVSS
jgi:hypothetical protein